MWVDFLLENSRQSWIPTLESNMLKIYKKFKVNRSSCNLPDPVQDMAALRLSAKTPCPTEGLSPTRPKL